MYNGHLYEGISIDKNNNIVFNWNKDNKNNDVIYLDISTSGEFNDDGIKYIYGYKYAPNVTQAQKKLVRDFIKAGNTSRDIEHFVENAVLEIEHIKPLNSFGALVRVKPSKYPSILSQIENTLTSYAEVPYYRFELIKQTYDKVSFNREKAYELLVASGLSEISAEDSINFVENKFEQLKASGELFQMKRFLPTAIRGAFHDFLLFENEFQRKLYERLQNIDVLIYDDFLTSGSTIKEIIGYLKSFSPNNTLTVFVLINQRRD